MRWLLFLFGFGVFAHPLHAQVVRGDTAIPKDKPAKPVLAADTASITKLPTQEPYWGRPQKAALYAALLPGLGQVYNKQYWKLPILYAGMGTLVYFWASNDVNFHRYNAAVNTIAEGGTNPYPQYSQQQVILVRDFYRRNRDYTIILSAVLYLLQITDAHVFAHLQGFNVNDNLALRPAWVPSLAATPSVGLSLTYHLSK